MWGPTALIRSGDCRSLIFIGTHADCAELTVDTKSSFLRCSSSRLLTCGSVRTPNATNPSVVVMFRLIASIPWFRP